MLVCGLAGALLTVLFLALYKLSHAEWRAAVVFPLLGLLQVAQYLSTVGTPQAWWDSMIGLGGGDGADPFHSSTFLPAFGSTVLFPAGLMIALLVYLKKNVYEFYRLAGWLLAVNAAVAVAALALHQTAAFAGSPFWSDVFSTAGAGRILLGTVLTLCDCYIMLVLYDALRRWTAGHLIVPMTTALVFDAVGYSVLLAWLGHTSIGTALGVHLPGKLFAGVVFGGLLQAFIWGFCPTIHRDPPLTVSGLRFLKALVWPLPYLAYPLTAVRTTQTLFSRWWPSGVLLTTEDRFEQFVTDAVYDVERFALVQMRVADVGRAEQDIRAWSANHSVSGWMAERDGMLEILLLGVTTATADWARRKVRAADANHGADWTGECVVYDHANPPMPPVSVAELLTRARDQPPTRPTAAKTVVTG